MSYNMTGADSIKCQWTREITNEYDVNFVGIQEHFKTVKTTNSWFSKQFNKYHSFTVPAHRLPGVENGRGRGGLVQLCDKRIDMKRLRIPSKSPRIQAQSLILNNSKILWINTYMPCDPQLQNFDATELIVTLSEVEIFLYLSMM